MTENTSQISPPLTGQDIGQAARATRAVLDRQLITTGLGFEVWVCLNLVATSSDPLDADGLVARAVHGLKIDEAAAAAAFAELVDHGLVFEGPLAGRTSPEITLTPAGTARFNQVRGAIGQITERLYGGVPAEDLAIAHRVLATVTSRANAELAS